MKRGRGRPDIVHAARPLRFRAVPGSIIRLPPVGRPGYSCHCRIAPACSRRGNEQNLARTCERAPPLRSIKPRSCAELEAGPPVWERWGLPRHGYVIIGSSCPGHARGRVRVGIPRCRTIRRPQIAAPAGGPVERCRCGAAHVHGGRNWAKACAVKFIADTARGPCRLLPPSCSGNSLNWAR